MPHEETSHPHRPVYHTQRRRSPLVFAGLIAVAVLVSLFFLVRGSRPRTPQFDPPPRLARPELARASAETTLPESPSAAAYDLADFSLRIPDDTQDPPLASHPPHEIDQPDRARRLRGDVGTDWRQSYTPETQPETPSQSRTSLTELRPYQEWNVHETAVDSLGRIGEAAVPLLVRALEHPEPKRRAEAAWLLGHVGPSAEPAVPALVRALDDASPEVQKSAARALGQIGPAAAEAVEPLMRLVEETEPVGISNESTDR